MDNSYPAKVYLELTTRCNLRCPMCVKQAPGSCIVEGDMPLSVFRNIMPALANIPNLVLNGIGEPLLYPDLEEVIRLARLQMPPDGTIAFQSNGFLLNKERAVALMQAGLDSICLSLDSLELYDTASHALFAVSHAIEALHQARQETGRPFRIGIEMVLSEETINKLPDMVQWSIGQEVDYLITTHLFLYEGVNEGKSLFNPNTASAIEIFEKYNRIAEEQGLSLSNSLVTYLKFVKTPEDHRLLAIADRMQKEARDRDVRLHLRSLIEHKRCNQGAVEAVFDQARTLAEQHGLELFLPSLQAVVERSCPFIAENAVFVSLKGNVMPCYFLWPSYSCRVMGEEIQVRERIFGNIQRQSLKEIWQKDEYRRFRQEAGEQEYAFCWSCSLGPCSDLVNDSLHGNDCYGSIVPCGHCQWCLGGVHCL